MNIGWLVVSTPLKNISQMGVLFPIYGKMFQTTNQLDIGMPPSSMQEPVATHQLHTNDQHMSMIW